MDATVASVLSLAYTFDLSDIGRVRLPHRRCSLHPQYPPPAIGRSLPIYILDDDLQPTTVSIEGVLFTGGFNSLTDRVHLVSPL